ncbi:MAG: type I-B CRISPR-associated endonuclease Cas1 [Petrotogaceae bacterium]|jgi:CRISPR-associated protein Cas1|nr:type I-B CRISPR-associated endonuclease Cas1 [Petrotogaceae bacterium]
MESIKIFSSGELKRHDNTLVLITKDQKKSIPVENVEDIKVFSEIILNKRTLEFLTKKNITMHFFNFVGNYIGTYYPLEFNQNGEVFLKQAEHYVELNKRMELARSFVVGEMMNLEYNLQTSGIKKESIKISPKILQIEKSRTVEELMIVEAGIRQEYYKEFDKLTNNPDFKFEKRTKQPPKNEVNALISFGNCMMYSDILKCIFKSHLDPRIGYLHSTNQRGFTLNLDISEIFKPIVVDQAIFHITGQRLLTKKDFRTFENGVYLNEEGRKKFITEYEKQLKKTVFSREKGRYMSYKLLMQSEVYKIENHLLQIKPYKPYIHI